MRLTIDKEIIIDAPASKIWKVLSEDFGNVGDWATIVPASKVRTSVDGEIIGRTCNTTFGDLTETLTNLDHDKLTMTYEVNEGMPAMVKDAKNTWTLFPQGSKTRVTSAISMKVSPIQGAIMGWMMSLKLSNNISSAMDDLKTYVETGAPSKRKQKSLAKLNRKELVAA